MKNVKMTVAAVWAWALVSGALAGRVATFTGAVSTDLSVDENWDGGTVPGDDAVAVVDFAKLGDATAVTNSAVAASICTEVPTLSAVIAAVLRVSKMVVGSTRITG